jgi:hypothetical protein
LQASVELGNISTQLEDLELRWLELAELAGDL